MKNFQETQGHLWRLCYDTEHQAFVWRCLGRLMDRDDSASGTPGEVRGQGRGAQHDTDPRPGDGEDKVCRPSDRS